MASDPIVKFAQLRFGTDAGLPADAVTRAPLPDWVAGAVDETRVPAEADSPITAEGRVPPPQEPPPVVDGTTTEVLAYYLPFHFYRTAWGIYIRGAGVWALARRLALPKKRPDANVLSSAYNLLLDHERLHFCAEYASSRVEVVTAEPCYDAYFKRRDAALHEEALANAYAIHGLHRRASLKLEKAASAWMATQGPGYCDYSKWLPPRFNDGEREAASNMTAESFVLNGLADAQHPVEFLFRSASSRRVPVYIILDLAVPWLRVVKPFPKDFGLQVYVYSNDHKPPHIHIECPPGTRRTRYRWPELTPLPRDSRLRASEEKRLRQYVDLYGPPIGRKITAIPWK